MFRNIMLACLLLVAFGINARQRVIPLYKGPAPGSANWTYSEKAFYSGTENTIVVNVSKPT